MSIDGKYLMLQTSKSAADVNLRHYADLTGISLTQPLEFKPIVGDWIGGFSFIHNIGTKFFFKTSFNAPLGKVIAIDITQPAQENWKDVIPEGSMCSQVSDALTINSLQLISLMPQIA